MKHLKVKVKLILGFAIIAALTSLVGIASIITMSVQNASYTYAINIHGKYLAKINRALAVFQELRLDMRDTLLATNEPGQLPQLMASMVKNTELFETLMADYRASIVRDDARAVFDHAMSLYKHYYKPALFKSIEDAQNEVDRNTEIEEIQHAREIATKITGDILEAISYKEFMLEKSGFDNTRQAYTISIMFLVIIAVTIVVSVVLGLFIANHVSAPLSVLTIFMKEACATGNLTLTAEEQALVTKFSERQDEIGQTIACFADFLERITTASDILQTVAGGNSAVKIPLLSDKDTIGLSLKKMTNGLDFMMNRIEGLLAESQAANRAKNAFMSRMSHEMLTPMNAVMSMLQFVQQCETSEQVKEYLDMMNTASKQLLQLIRDILDVANMESKEIAFEHSLFEFNVMFNEVQKTINASIREKKQTFTHHINPSIPQTLRGDKDRLAKAITCLLDNAVKFTPDHGKIHFAATVLGKDSGNIILQIEVADNGIGISKEQQRTLFDLFEQVDGSNARKYGGVGLGLALAKRIIEAMGGKIWVDSEPGKGTTFTFICTVQEAE